MPKSTRVELRSSKFHFLFLYILLFQLRGFRGSEEAEVESSGVEEFRSFIFSFFPSILTRSKVVRSERRS
jgi:hypothetical protein